MDMDAAERGGVEWVSEFCPVKGSIERHDHCRSTRQNHLLSLPSIRGSMAGKSQFLYHAAAEYNSLSPEFVNMSASNFDSVCQK